MGKLSETSQFLIGLAFVAFSMASCLIVGFATGGIIVTLLIAIVLLVLLGAAVLIWRLRKGGNTTVYRALIAGTGAIAVVALGLPTVANTVLTAVWPLLHSVIPVLPERFPAYRPIDAWPVLLFLLGFSFLVIRSLQPRRVTENTARPLETDFPEPTFRDRLQNFTGLLKDDLEARDRETSWSHA